MSVYVGVVMVNKRLLKLIAKMFGLDSDNCTRLFLDWLSSGYDVAFRGELHINLALVPLNFACGEESFAFDIIVSTQRYFGIY